MIKKLGCKFGMEQSLRYFELTMDRYSSKQFLYHFRPPCSCWPRARGRSCWAWGLFLRARPGSHGGSQYSLAASGSAVSPVGWISEHIVTCTVQFDGVKTQRSAPRTLEHSLISIWHVLLQMCPVSLGPPQLIYSMNESDHLYHWVIKNSIYIIVSLRARWDFV